MESREENLIFDTPNLSTIKYTLVNIILLFDILP